MRIFRAGGWPCSSSTCIYEVDGKCQRPFHPDKPPAAARRFHVAPRTEMNALASTLKFRIKSAGASNCTKLGSVMDLKMLNSNINSLFKKID